MSTGIRRTSSEQRVLDPDDQLALLLRRCRARSVISDTPAADELRPLLEQAVVELLVALAEAAHVDVEIVDLRALVFSLIRWANFREYMQQTREQYSW